MRYQGTTYYWNNATTQVDKITQQYRVTNNNFYTTKWSNLQLNQTCHGANTQNFVTGKLAPDQGLNLAAKKSTTWTVDWDVTNGPLMSATCIATGYLTCKTSGSVRATYWNKHYDLDVSWMTVDYCAPQPDIGFD